jgi:hypothetical protein
VHVLRPLDPAAFPLRVATPSLLGAAALVALLAFDSRNAAALDPTCSTPGGDAAGWALASGDFNGDGVVDIAIGSPCAHASGFKRAGRVTVHSGDDGRRLAAFRGTKLGQQFGASLAFVGDLDGDAGDELVVGSFGWSTASLAGAGKLEILNDRREVLLFVEGMSAGGDFGESVAVVPDADGDGLDDLLVGAGDEREGAERKGRAYLISSADGAELDRSTGVSRFDGWGSTVAAAPDVNGDATPDLIVGSNLADGPAGENVGTLKVLSGLDMSVVLLEISGGTEHKLGEAVGVVGLAEGLYVGVPGADSGGKNKAGDVRLYAWDGTASAPVTEPTPAVTASFGSALAVLGDVDGDSVADFAASAPVRDAASAADVGALYTFSGASGGVIWNDLGNRKNLRLGASLAATPDLDGDGAADLLVSAPGDVAMGRRGAGTVRLLSGADGGELLRFSGRRGLETRIIAASWAVGDGPVVRSFSTRGRRRELRQSVLRGLASGELSVATLDGNLADPAPEDLKVVVSTGRGGSDDRVLIVRAGRHGFVVSELRGFDGQFPGGVSVAAADVSNDADEDLIVAQADGTGNGVVRLRILDRLDPDPFGKISWPGFVQFRAFDTGTVVQSQPVNAVGAHVVAGNVIVNPPAPGAADNAEIIVGPIQGAPVVRVMNASGGVLAEWFAYPPSDNQGTSLALGDLDGNGTLEIVTAPSTGQPWVRAFNGDGTPFLSGGVGVSFFALEASYTAGLRVAVADVDLDGRGEVLVATAPAADCVVKAFEVNGTPVTGFSDLQLFGPDCRAGLALVGTDRFLRF